MDAGAEGCPRKLHAYRPYVGTVMVTALHICEVSCRPTLALYGDLRRPLRQRYVIMPILQGFKELPSNFRDVL